MHNGRYQNTLVLDEALRIIFEDQYITGLLPVGLKVNNDFVMKREKNTGNVLLENRQVSAGPNLSSFECFSDMLSSRCFEIISSYLKKYYLRFELAFDWAYKRIRKDSGNSKNPLGWYPEYESKHVPESWASAHILLFLKKYCEFLSSLIVDNARKSLHAYKLKKEDVPLYESYGITESMLYMATHQECRSALVFGPFGCGKSDVGKYLASQMSWDYIELTPAMFLSEGPLYVNPQTKTIFKLLSGIKEAVVFFDEVNVFQETLGERSSAWFIADFLARFAELIKNKNIKLVLSSNMVNDKDDVAMTPDLAFGINPSLIRLQRIDLVLPMGGINWYQRIQRLNQELEKVDELTSEEKNLKSSIFALLDKREGKIVKSDVKGDQLKNFLKRTNYMSNIRLNQILEAIFVKKDKRLYKIFFSKSQKTDYFDFQETDLFRFQKILENETLCDYIRFSPEKPGENSIEKIIKENIFETKSSLQK